MKHIFSIPLCAFAVTIGVLLCLGCSSRNQSHETLIRNDTNTELRLKFAAGQEITSISPKSEKKINLKPGEKVQLSSSNGTWLFQYPDFPSYNWLIGTRMEVDMNWNFNCIAKLFLQVYNSGDTNKNWGVSNEQNKNTKESQQSSQITSINGMKVGAENRIYSIGNGAFITEKAGTNEIILMDIGSLSGGEVVRPKETKWISIGGFYVPRT